MIRLLLLIGLLALTSCSSRDHGNPFDPENSSTHGTPALVQAIAGDREVRVSWDLEHYSDLVQIRLLRKGEGPELNVLERTEGGSGSFVDRGVTNGTTFVYRLELLSSKGEPVFTATEAATPGVAEPWVADASGGLVRLSPDGRDILFRTDEAGSVLDLEVVFDGSAWAADYALGAVLHVDRGGQIDSAWPLEGASQLDFDQESGLLWVGTFTTANLRLYERSGEVARLYENAGRVEDVAASPDSGVFVAALETGVSRYTMSAMLWRAGQFLRPVAVVPRGDGACWVVDRGLKQIALLDSGGQLLRQVSASDPAGACSDGQDGCWVADPGRGAILHLDAEAREDYLLAIGAESLTWDPTGRRLWMTFPEEGKVGVVEGIDRSHPEINPTVTLTRTGGRPVRVAGYWGRSFAGE